MRRQGAEMPTWIAPARAEAIAKGAFAFVEDREVDSEQFVKMYLAGILWYGELSKAGRLVFEFVYREISGREARIRIPSPLAICSPSNGIEIDRTDYQRGSGELLAKGFLFRSLAADVYSVNVRFMFNGDRMALVQGYRRRGRRRQGN